MVMALLLGGLGSSGAQVRSPEPAVPDSIGWCTEFTSTPTVATFAIGSVAAALMAINEDSGPLRKSLDDPFIERPLKLGNAYGSGWGVGGLGLVTLAYGHATGDNDAVELGEDLATSFVATSALVAVLKRSIGRTRPNGGKYAMPSGHTAGAFSSVPVMWYHAGWKTGLAFGSLSVLTGLARIEDNKHYLSDVVAGATLGLVVGRLTVARRHESCWRVQASSGGVALVRGF